ncbi:MAG: hypothetical protein QM756_32220 [Polyangiaceae bacterium]
MADDANADTLGRNRCVDCSTLSPKTDTNYTLISARHGWRLTRQVDESGRNVLQWRCPRCWEKYRRRDSLKA